MAGFVLKILNIRRTEEGEEGPALGFASSTRTAIFQLQGLESHAECLT